jgi:hypothetical protein
MKFDDYNGLNCNLGEIKLGHDRDGIDYDCSSSESDPESENNRYICIPVPYKQYRITAKISPIPLYDHQQLPLYKLHGTVKVVQTNSQDDELVYDSFRIVQMQSIHNPPN